MGFSPRQIDDMTPWEFGAAWATYVKSNSAPDSPQAPSREEYLAAISETIH